MPWGRSGFFRTPCLSRMSQFHYFSFRIRVFPSLILLVLVLLLGAVNTSILVATRRDVAERLLRHSQTCRSFSLRYLISALPFCPYFPLRTWIPYLIAPALTALYSTTLRLAPGTRRSHRREKPKALTGIYIPLPLVS